MNNPADLPTRRLEALIVARVLYLLERPESELGAGKGLTRSMHIAALAERTHDSYFGSDNHDLSPGFFSDEVRTQIGRRLRNAHLQPEESRFRDVLDWKGVHRERLRWEMRTIILRMLVDEEAQYRNAALELHMLFDLRMRYNAPGYVSALEDTDFTEYPELAALRDHCLELVPNARAA